MPGVRGTGRRPGRPRLPKKEKRGVRLLLSFTEGEFAAVRRAAGQIAPGVFARELVLSALANGNRRRR